MAGRRLRDRCSGPAAADRPQPTAPLVVLTVPPWNPGGYGAAGHSGWIPAGVAPGVAPGRRLSRIGPAAWRCHVWRRSSGPPPGRLSPS